MSEPLRPDIVARLAETRRAMRNRPAGPPLAISESDIRTIVTVYGANRQTDDERRKAKAIQAQMKRMHRHLEAERIAAPSKAPTMLEIASVICESFGVTPAELVGPWRPRRVTQARIAGYVLARSLRKMSLPAIAGAFDRADHTTIMLGLRVHEKHMSRPDYRQRFEVALSKLTRAS